MSCADLNLLAVRHVLAHGLLSRVHPGPGSTEADIAHVGRRQLYLGSLVNKRDRSQAGSLVDLWSDIFFCCQKITGSYIPQMRMQRPDRFGLLLLRQEQNIVIIITVSVCSGTPYCHIHSQAILY
jgi:hypothetical protein